MSWVRLDDRMSMSVKVRGLADDSATGDRAKTQRNEALGHFVLLLTWVGGEGTDGFVTRDVVELFGTTASTARLLRARYERAPLLHQRDKNGRAPECSCLDGREWKADFDYLIHDYLDRNPSRAEGDVNRAKKAELRNPRLKEAVRLRDRDVCRYCGIHCKHSDRTSDAGLTFDHVDPEIADGINNLVVACRGCNRKKARRTPNQADMILRDPPTTAPVTRPATVTTPVAGSGATPDTTPGATAGTADVPAQPRKPGTDPSTDQRRAQVSTQTQRSPGRDGDGLVTTPEVRSTVEPPPSIPIGPPPPRFTGSPGNPYLRTQRPFPDLHAGHPPQPEEMTR